MVQRKKKFRRVGVGEITFKLKLKFDLLLSKVIFVRAGSKPKSKFKVTKIDRQILRKIDAFSVRYDS